MQVKVCDTYEAMSRQAAKLILAELKRRPNLLFCASAGNTPTLSYALLAAERARHPRLFEKLRVLQLDEWGELPAAHPASCRDEASDRPSQQRRLPRSQEVNHETFLDEP